MKKININNTHVILCVPIDRVFRDYATNILYPEFQRSLDKDHVDEIKEFYLKFPNKINDNRLLLGHLHNTNNYYVIDGQHRLTALYEIIRNSNDFKDIEVILTIKNCNNMDELYQTYKEVNQNSPLDQFQKIVLENTDRVEAEIWSNIQRYITSNYKKFLKKDTNCHQPNIFIDDFMIKLRNTNIINYIKTADGIIDKLNSINNEIYNKYYEICSTVDTQFVKNKMIKILDKIKNKTPDNKPPFCLGLDFDWTKLILDTDYPISFAGFHDSNIRTITRKQIRDEVWETYAPINENTNKSLDYMDCYCCKNKKFNRYSHADWHLGHVIPSRYGGQFTTENLRPICPNCNSEMKTMNMNDYMKLKKYL
jgi:hypothetical protein